MYGVINQVKQRVESKMHTEKSNSEFSGKQLTLYTVQGNERWAKPIEVRRIESEICEHSRRLMISLFSSLMTIFVSYLNVCLKAVMLLKTKLFYIARHGSGPVILKKLVNEVDRSRNVYTLLLDVKQAAKQIDFLINYCSISENQVATRNLD